jgi:hypothetical protein
MINPYYYYGFDQPGKIESLVKGLKQKTISVKNKMLLEERREILIDLKNKNKMKNLEEMVKNVYKIDTKRL